MAIQKEVKNVCETPSSRADIEDCLLDGGRLYLPEDIFGVPMSEDVAMGLSHEATRDNYDRVARVVRGMLFARYFNSRVAFTVVTTTNEDDAFDMFEALNTTGEPLTAFETFKPKVIEAETIQDYERSPSRQSIKRIEDYLDKYQKADDRQRATRRFWYRSRWLRPARSWPPSCMLSGDIYGRNMTRLADGEGMTARRDFVRSLADLAVFMESTWNVKGPLAPRFRPGDRRRRGRTSGTGSTEGSEAHGYDCAHCEVLSESML